MRKLVAAVIHRKGGKFLILRRKLNWRGWEFVKGEVGRETYKQAVLREVREETGVRGAKIVCKLPAEIFYHHRDIRGHTTSKQTAYLVEYMGGKIKISPEHNGHMWVSADAARKRLTHMSHKTFLKFANSYLKKQKARQRKDLIKKLSKKHITLVRFSGRTISLKYDGKKLSNKVVKRNVKVVGDWSRTRNIVYYDRNLDEPGVLPILIHETVEKYVAQKYNMDVDTEAHRIAQSVEKEWLADKKWLKHAKIVSRAWVKANNQRIGNAKFY